MSTSQKHRVFTSEPMGKKSVKELPGIGDKIGDQLIEKGYNQASTVLGQYLVLQKNQEQFVKWLKNETNANNKHANDCYNALSEWHEQFLD